MKTRFPILLSVCLAFIHASASVIPEPAKTESRPGSFTLDGQTGILFSGDAAKGEAAILASFLRPATGLPLPVAAASDAANGHAIRLKLGAKDLGEEGYRLEVSPAGIDISAGTTAGLFYGAQTLRQLLPPAIFAATKQIGPKWEIPDCTIEDKPRFGWRGLMLDSSRHFQSKAFILRLLDLMAAHKLNVFHWHLTDDHGWRLEIKKYPKLTETGAWRQQPEYPENNGVYGGFYTQEDVREVVAFAAARHIVVVPEIEIPGHSQAAIASYPELSCDGKPGFVEYFYHYPHATVAGQKTWVPNSCNVYCASSAKVREFLKDVLTETMALFPGPYIHIGGDEVVPGYWRACPRCRALMKEKGLKNVHQLQADMTAEFDRFLSDHGRHMIGWDEILQGGLTPGAAVMSWRGMAGGIKAAQAGHAVVMSPNVPLYLNRSATLPVGVKLPVFAPPNNTLEAIYKFDPMPAALNAGQRKLVLGTEACIWTEKYHTPEWLEMVAFPRLCALAEIAWCEPGAKDLTRFRTRLDEHLRRLDILGVRFRSEAPKATTGH